MRSSESPWASTGFSAMSWLTSTPDASIGTDATCRDDLGDDRLRPGDGGRRAVGDRVADRQAGRGGPDDDRADGHDLRAYSVDGDGDGVRLEVEHLDALIDGLDDHGKRHRTTRSD